MAQVGPPVMGRTSDVFEQPTDTVGNAWAAGTMHLVRALTNPPEVSPELTIDRPISNVVAMAGATTTTRMSSEERRDEVVAAAVTEFAEHGYHAASTGAIARRAGISQPYIYALFPDKRALFLAAHRHIIDRIRAAFTEAAVGIDGAEARIEAMGKAYKELLAHREEISFQLQSYAAAGDPEVGPEVRKGFEAVWDTVLRVSGAPEERVREFIQTGMLLNVAAMLDLPDKYCGFGLDH
jgi:AcrR family transcriptional regulator